VLAAKTINQQLAACVVWCEVAGAGLLNPEKLAARIIRVKRV
jgi:hypothetical protein